LLQTHYLYLSIRENLFNMETTNILESLKAINAPNQINPLSQILEAERIYRDMANVGLVEKRKYNLKSVDEFNVSKVRFNVSVKIVHPYSSK
jgi:hypothetical protein